MDISGVTLLTITTVSAPSFPALTGSITPPFISSFDIPPFIQDYSSTSDQGSSTTPSASTDASPTYALTASSPSFPNIFPTTPPSISSYSSSTTTPNSSFLPTSESTISSTSFRAPPALATADAPSEISNLTNGLISKGGIVGLSLALGVLFLGSLLLFWCYRRQKQFHAKAMLIAPRLSGNMDGDVSEIREASQQVDNGCSERDETHRSGAQRMASPHEPVGCLQNLATFVKTPTRRKLSNGTVSEQNTAQKGLECELQDCTETPTMHTHELRDEYSESYRTPLHWHEAFDRLDELRKDLSPAPLRIVKKSHSNPSHQAQSLSPSPFNVLKKSASNPSYQAQQCVAKSPSLTFSVTSSEGAASSTLDREDTRKGQNRELTLAVLEGDPNVHHGTYTPSEYSRTSEGEPVQGQNDSRGDIYWERLHENFQSHERGL